MTRPSNTTRLRVALCLAVSAVLLALSGVAGADLPDPLAAYPDHAGWRTAATDRLHARDGDADRDYWHFANGLTVGILNFDELAAGSGPGPGTGEALERVYVREASCLLGGRLGGDGPWICAPAGWSIEQAGLVPLPESIIQCESGGNPLAYNPSGAAGLAQFMPGTWASLNGWGDPRSASAAEQRWRASLLYAHGYGRSHWVC